MPIEPPITSRPRHRRAEERWLRAGILRLGSLLGWDAPTVSHFAESVTGRPLSGCGCAELRRVLAAYATVARRVRGAQARQPGATGPHGRTL
jgi:hypothetical protein